MATLTVKIQGVEELRRKLANLPLKVQGKIIRPALRAGAKIVADAARAGAPTATGQLRRSIKVRSGLGRKKGVYKMVAITGKGDYKGDEFYGSFVEYGHRRGKRSRSVAHLQEKASRAGKAGNLSLKAQFQAQADRIDRRSEVKPKPYMKPAFDRTKGQVEQVVTSQIAAGIEREASK